jgi:hypothetical protein
MKTFEGYVQADYSPENWIIMLNAKTEGDTNIDNAASVEEVMTALANAQAAMAAINTLLDDAKAAAHASLNAALAGYAQDDYSPENWTILLDTMEVIGSSASVADVTMALNNAHAAMAAVHTLLTDAKIAAHISLNDALAVYKQADYSPDNWRVFLPNRQVLPLRWLGGRPIQAGGRDGVLVSSFAGSRWREKHGRLCTLVLALTCCR